jgi:hypothetical protein
MEADDIMEDKPEFLGQGPEPESPREPPVATLPEGKVDQIMPAAAEVGSSPVITFQGNSYDLASVIGVTVGAMVLFSCITCNLGFYCLPFVPIILGIIGLVAAKDSVDPQRTKLLSWLSVGSGAVILLLIFLFVALYIGIIVFAVMADNSGY